MDVFHVGTGEFENDRDFSIEMDSLDNTEDEDIEGEAWIKPNDLGVGQVYTMINTDTLEIVTTDANSRIELHNILGCVEDSQRFRYDIILMPKQAWRFVDLIDDIGLNTGDYLYPEDRTLLASEKSPWIKMNLNLYTNYFGTPDTFVIETDHPLMNLDNIGLFWTSLTKTSDGYSTRSEFFMYYNIYDVYKEYVYPFFNTLLEYGAEYVTICWNKYNKDSKDTDIVKLPISKEIVRNITKCAILER
jgi:hypothetical protein